MDWFIGECMRGTVYEEKEGYETKVPVRGREMRFDRDRKIRCLRARRDRNVFARKDETGVVRLLVDVWWHLLPRAGDCAGGRKVVPEVTLCWQSPRVRFLFRRWPATGRRAWWNRLSFLGKCSSAACLGRPVQVCDRHVIAIESRRFDNSVRWMPMASTGWEQVPFYKSASLIVADIISFCASSRSLFTDLYNDTRFSRDVLSIIEEYRYWQVEKRLFYDDAIINGNLTNGLWWLNSSLRKFQSVTCCTFYSNCYYSIFSD